MNYDYGLLDSFYLSEDSITGARLYPLGIYRIVEIFNISHLSDFTDKYMLAYTIDGMSHKQPISQHSLETLFKTSLIEEYEYYETS